MAITTGMALMAAASVAGGMMAADASEDAANSQANSAANAQALEKQMFDKQNELNAPFRENGLAGQNKLMDLLGLSDRTTTPGFGSAMRDFGMSDFQADPGYQYRLEQGQKAIERSASARGGLTGGRILKDLTRFGQGEASQEYGNAFNRFQVNRSNKLNPLQSLSGAGQTATGQMGQAAQNYAQNAGNLMTQQGNARASGYVGSANGWNNAIGQGMNQYNQMNMMNKMFGSGGLTPEQTYIANTYSSNYG